MPNRNYLKGRSFEQKTAKWYREQGYLVLRSAGSKGLFDLVAVNSEHIMLIQCKVVDSMKKAAQLSKAFKASPPMTYCCCDQRLEVWIKGGKLRTTTVYAYQTGG